MPKKQRGVFERPPGSGTWWIRYHDADGREHREKVGCYQAAADAYMARKVAISEGKFKPPSRASGITFSDLLTEAFTDRKGRLAATTYDGDERKKGPLLKWFGSMRAAKITPPMISARLRELRDKGLKGSTCNRYRNLLSAIFAWGVENGKLEANPVHRVASYREGDGVIRFLDADEEKALRDAVREYYPECEAELDVALNTGLRRNELYRLTWVDVDLERSIVTVRGKRHANSRESSRRFVRLNSTARLALRLLAEQSKGSAYVCPGPHAGTELDRDWRDWFEASVKRAGLERFRYHDLRHTFASRLVMAGVPLLDVKELLGHRDIKMTLRYAHLAPEHQAAAVEKLVTAYPKKAGPVVIPITKKAMNE